MLLLWLCVTCQVLAVTCYKVGVSLEINKNIEVDEQILFYIFDHLLKRLINLTIIIGTLSQRLSTIYNSTNDDILYSFHCL